jgi:hypothetical protein
MMALSKNAKTGLVLASVAAAWFIGVIVKYWFLGR